MPAVHDQSAAADYDSAATSSSPRGGPATLQQQQAARAAFPCSFPGCSRTFSELWKLRKHHRAPSQPGCGARGHDCELKECPRCLAALHPDTAHVGCKGGLAAPQQAAKRRRYREAHESYKLQRCSSASAPGSSRASPSVAGGPLRSAASETDALLPPVSDLLASLPLELRVGYAAGSMAALPVERTTASPPLAATRMLAPPDGSASLCASPLFADPLHQRPVAHVPPQQSMRQEAATIVDLLLGGDQPEGSPSPGLLTASGMSSSTFASAGGGMAASTQAACAFAPEPELQAHCAGTYSGSFEQQLSWQPSLCSSGSDVSQLTSAAGHMDTAFGRMAMAQQQLPLSALGGGSMPFGVAHAARLPLDGSCGDSAVPPAPAYHQLQLPPQQFYTNYDAMSHAQPMFAASAEDPAMPASMPLPDDWA